ncbi:coiled-coil domain-containing protein 115 isoform X1 [Schistocerca americana]|uniref:coiled-coil domain-containing protein 115 n=2 Tax=Schistocerca TaxID=7008 RepID=UPI001F4FE79B|nr:coiled-coil domain-containing protein 115 isoform X1 [Schistocerca americana]XP_047112666.1 coiled-coil domain-containing protein 115 [Schistocerca piceifrons]
MEHTGFTEKTVKMDIEETCKKLDLLCIEELEIMEEYIRCKVELEKLMKAGFLNIAKARYIMGKTSVSSLQLPSEDASDVTALCKVVLDKKSSAEDREFQLMLDFKDQGKQVDDVTPAPRKRNITDENKLMEEKPDSKFKTQDSDPLRWFGVLVPQNLRQAQTNFQSALPLVIECANLQLKLLDSYDKHKKALRRKKDISTT